MFRKPLFLCRIYLLTKIILVLMYVDWKMEIEKEETVSLKNDNFCVWEH